ncbi:MAG: S8 family serine peptidase [Armatimonas sp.]
MCNYASGELILAYDKGDLAASELIQQIENNEEALHVHIKARISDLLEELTRQEAPQRQEFPEELFLLEVPAGDEIFKIAYLYQLYARFYSKNYPEQPNPSFELIRIAPNSRMTLSSVKPIDFAFSAEHSSHYMPMIEWPPMPLRYPGPVPVKVAILDSGIDASNSTPLNVVACYDVRYPTAPVQDLDGHGTAVARIINAVAPGVKLHIYKVADSTGLYEWDVLAGLIQATGANVINLSAEFGLGTNPCTTCGNITGTVRSTVFQHVMQSIASLPNPPLVVVAAGNGGNNDLAYPARYAEAIAVGAVDSTYTRHTSSNYGVTDANGSPHNNVFMAPGGQRSTPLELVGSIASSPGTTDCHGTSFAAAYVSGLVAICFSHSLPPAGVLHCLRNNADNTYPGYIPDHGNGIPRH